MYIYVSNSAKEATSKKSRNSRKRRHNQNAEIEELASFLSSSAQSLSATGSSLVATSGGNKPPTVAVLRLTLNFLKLHNFVKDGELSQKYTYIILLVQSESTYVYDE